MTLSDAVSVVPYTVVGGFASASSLHHGSRDGDEQSLAVLSARPDGPRLNMLSLMMVMRQESADIAEKAIAVLRRSLPTGDTGASISVASTSLTCAWHSHFAVFNATLFRLVCHSAQWTAAEAMESVRLRMRLTLSLPEFSARFTFRTEALQRLPSSGISGCVDFAYHAGDRPRDFNEWATTQQLVGIDRVYVADQLRYRDQVRDQVSRGFAFFTHDYPHRYVTPGGRDAPQPPTTYAMFYVTTSAYNLLCLHEHWYDDWVFVSYSTDEYFVLKGIAEPPKRREALVANAIERVWEKLKVPAADRISGWRRRPTNPYCTSMLCMYRPFYGPSHFVGGEAAEWTLPGNESTRLQYGSEGQLSIERFTHRFRVMPPRGSVRKCLVHPDWRLGSRLKVHSFHMQACPLRGLDECNRGWPGLRSICLELCGVWGNESTRIRDACHGFTNDGMLLRGVEVAHFRVTPQENQAKGYDVLTWLSELALPVRQVLAETEANRQNA